MTDVYIALGTNMGNRLGNLRLALEALAPHVAVEKKSSIYESEPMYVEQQPRFYNMVIRGETELTPHDLLGFLQSIESEMGRPPDTHNMPRTIDLDILLHGELILELPELTIPHARMHERAFVLAPLDEIASFHVHPKLRKPVVDLLDELGGYEEKVWRAEEQL